MNQESLWLLFAYTMQYLILLFGFKKLTAYSWNKIKLFDFIIKLILIIL